MPKSRTFRITNIDSKLMRKFKLACSYYGLNMCEIFIQYMNSVVNDFEWAIQHGHLTQLISKNDIFKLGVNGETRTIKQSVFRDKGGKNHELDR